MSDINKKIECVLNKYKNCSYFNNIQTKENNNLFDKVQQKTK